MWMCRHWGKPSGESPICIPCKIMEGWCANFFHPDSWVCLPGLPISGIYRLVDHHKSKQELCHGKAWVCEGSHFPFLKFPSMQNYNLICQHAFWFIKQECNTFRRKIAPVKCLTPWNKPVQFHFSPSKYPIASQNGPSQYSNLFPLILEVRRGWEKRKELIKSRWYSLSC